MNVLSTGFRTLVRREILRFVRRPRNTFVPPLVTNVLYFSVFGVILPGLVVLGSISNSFENASFSIFHGRWNNYVRGQTTRISLNEESA